MKKWTRFVAAMAMLFAVASCSKGGDQDPFLKIESQTTFSVAAENASGEIKISSNVAWTISGATEWCKPEVTSGSGSRTVALIIADNDTRNPRSATLTVASSQGKYAVNVSQEGNANLNFHEEGSYKAAEINRQSNAVNIVIMGDGFILDDLTDGGAYDQAMDRAREAFFDIEPFRSYRDHFNIYYVYAESKQRGATYGYGHDGSTRQNFASTVRNTAFSASFTQEANSTATSCDYQKVFNYARRVPVMKEGADVVLDDSGNPVSGAITDPNNILNKTVIILVINDQRYAGTCLMYGTGACIGMCPMSTSPGTMSFEATLRHEVGGHGFGRFADEYIYYDEALPSSGGSYNATSLAAWQGIGHYLNVSLSNVADQAPNVWLPFLADSETYPEVGFFEGSCTYAKGIWRAEQNSIMNNNVRYFNGPQAYFIYSKIKTLSNETPSWEEFVTNDAARIREQANANSTAAQNALGAGEKFIPLAPPILIGMPQ